MTMMQKVQAKRSKKGFTLVELVIVIAILAILAAVAIPVITTTIKSAKLSTMESNAASLNMMVKEAINCSKAKIKATTWNDKNYLDATIDDVALENDLYNETTKEEWSATDAFYYKSIQGKPYGIEWDEDSKQIIVTGDGYSKECSISSFDDDATSGLAIAELEKDAE